MRADKEGAAASSCLLCCLGYSPQKRDVEEFWTQSLPVTTERCQEYDWLNGTHHDCGTMC